MTNLIDKDIEEKYEYRKKLEEELEKHKCSVPEKKRSIDVCGALEVPTAYIIFGSCKFSLVCKIKKRFTLEDVKDFLQQKEREKKLVHWKLNKTT